MSSKIIVSKIIIVFFLLCPFYIFLFVCYLFSFKRGHISHFTRIDRVFFGICVLFVVACPNLYNAKSWSLPRVVQMNLCFAFTLPLGVFSLGFFSPAEKKSEIIHFALQPSVAFYTNVSKFRIKFVEQGYCCKMTILSSTISSGTALGSCSNLIHVFDGSLMDD